MNFPQPSNRTPEVMRAASAPLGFAQQLRRRLDLGVLA